MARRSDHSREELQELALAAAERILDTQGEAALSARKVATEIGYSAGALYLVFQNRDDLCWQLNGRTLQKLLTALEQVNCDDPIECLKQFAEIYLTFATVWTPRWSLLFEHRSAEDVDAPQWLTQQINQLFHKLEQSLMLCFPSLDPAAISQMARTLWGGVHGVTILSLRDKLFLNQQTDPRQMLDHLVETYVRGVAVQGSV